MTQINISTSCGWKTQAQIILALLECLIKICDRKEVLMFTRTPNQRLPNTITRLRIEILLLVIICIIMYDYVFLCDCLLYNCIIDFIS